MTQSDRNGSCPDAETLGAFLERRTVSVAAAGIERHVIECDRCRELLDQVIDLLSDDASAYEFDLSRER